MDGLNAFDATIMTFIQEYFHNPVTDFIFPYITYLGESGAIWIIIAVTLLFFKKTRLCGVMIGFSLLLTFLSGELLLKNVVDRARPYTDYPDYTALLIAELGSFSFPSGHSASSFTAATIIFYFNKKFGTAAYILAFLIMFSRVFLFVHYPSDVLAGAALGVVFALVTIFIQKQLSKKWRFFMRDKYKQGATK